MLGDEPISYTTYPDEFAWVDHLAIPNPLYGKGTDVADQCGDIKLIGLLSARLGGPSVVICTRLKNHTGRHHEAHKTVLATWRNE
jgi:hypothetical protein